MTTEDLSLIQDEVDPKFLDPQQSPQRDDGDELMSAKDLMELPAENTYGFSLLDSQSEEYLNNQRQSNAYGMNQRVRNEGVFTPIIVREWKDGTRSIFDGHHRLIAAYDNNPNFQVPVVIEKVDDNFENEFPSAKLKETPEITEPALDFLDPNLYQEIKSTDYVETDYTPVAISSEEDIKNIADKININNKLLLQVKGRPDIVAGRPQSLTYNEQDGWVIKFRGDWDNVIKLSDIEPIDRIVDTLETFEWETGNLDDSLAEQDPNYMYNLRDSDGFARAMVDMDLLLANKEYSEAGIYMARLVNELMRKADLVETMPALTNSDRTLRLKTRDYYIEKAKELKKFYGPKSKVYNFTKERRYANGWNSAIKETDVGGTGRPNVIIENPRPLTESAFDDIKPLMGAVDEVINKTNRVIGVSSVVDSGDIEDFQVRALAVVNGETGERRLRLRFKLTAWAGSTQARTVEKLVEKDEPDEYGSTWELGDSIDVKSNYLADNGDVVETSDIRYRYTASSYVYNGKLSTAAGKEVNVSLSRVNTSDELDAVDDYTSDYAPVVFHNAVAIDLPLDATEEDIANALKSAGVRNPRATEPEDVTVLAENRLISVFGKNADPTRPMQDEKQRDKLLKKIKKDWGVSAEDVNIAIDSTGYVTFLLPEDTAEKISEKTNSYALEHEISYSGVEKFLSSIIPDYLEMPFDDQFDEYAKLLVQILSPNGEGLRSTIQRFSEGKSLPGLSSEQDIRTGGADYVFFYPRTDTSVRRSSHGSNYKVSILFDPAKLYRRADFYANHTDQFGKRDKHADIVNNAIAGKDSTAEVMLKNGVSIDSAMGVVVSPYMREKLLARLKEQGIDEINEIPVEDFVTTEFLGKPNKKGTYDRKDFSNWIDNHFISRIGVKPDAIRSFLDKLGSAPFDLPSVQTSGFEDPVVVGFSDDMSLIVMDRAKPGSFKKAVLRIGESQFNFEIASGFNVTPILDMSDEELNNVFKSLIDNNGFYSDATSYLGDIYKMPSETGLGEYSPVGTYGTADSVIAKLNDAIYALKERSITPKQLANYIFRMIFSSPESYRFEEITDKLIEILQSNEDVLSEFENIVYVGEKG